MSELITSEIKTFVRFYYPGALFAEDETVCVDSFNPETLELPDGAYAFQSYKIETMTTVVDGVEFKKSNPPFNVSKMYYPNGSMLSLDEIGTQFGKDSIIYKNVSGNGYLYAVKTRCGNYQFFNPEKDAILIKEPTE